MKSIRTSAALAVLLLLAPRARAETQAERADALFKEANDLATAGKYSDACPKFEQSFELDPALGTQFNLADCYEHTQRPATAWKLFLEVARTAGIAGKKARQESATKRATALEPRVPRITISITDPNPPSDLEIKRDGTVVPRAQWASPIAVDLGKHVVEASASGRKPIRIEREIKAEGAREKIEVPALEAIATPETEKAPVEPPKPAPTMPEQPASGSSALRGTGYALVSVGVVSMIAGGIFALRARALDNSANDKCPETACSDQGAVDNSHDAQTAATWSTVTVGAGLGLVGVGVILVLTSPSSNKPATTALHTSPIVGPGTLGWGLQGAF